MYSYWSRHPASHQSTRQSTLLMGSLQVRVVPIRYVMNQQVNDTRIFSDELVEIYYTQVSEWYAGTISGLTLSFPDDHVIHPAPPDMHFQGIFDGVHMSRCSGFVRLIGLTSLHVIPC